MLTVWDRRQFWNISNVLFRSFCVSHENKEREGGYQLTIKPRCIAEGKKKKKKKKRKYWFEVC